MMEDAASRGKASWFQATARQRVAGLLDPGQLSPSSSDHPSVFRARTFICSICLRHSTTASSSAAASWTERMCSLRRRKANSWAAPLPR